MPDLIELLLVMCGERRTQLLEILESSDAHVLTVSSCREARRVLKTHPTIEVVIADLSHPDGNWCDILKCLVDSGISASIVVSAPYADDRLWSEVLWRGAYDLLVEPHESFEVRRIVEGAARAAGTSRVSSKGSAVTSARAS